MKKYVLPIMAVAIMLIGVVFYSGSTRSDDVDSMTDAAVRIQYGWGSKNKLKKMCADEFEGKENIEDFCMGRKLYSVEERWVKKISDNETEVTLQVYSPDLTIHKYTFVQTEDGKYCIANIEHDM